MAGLIVRSNERMKSPWCLWIGAALCAVIGKLLIDAFGRWAGIVFAIALVCVCILAYRSFRRHMQGIRGDFTGLTREQQEQVITQVSPEIAAELRLLMAQLDTKTEPCASPNGGPATSLGNLGVTEGPPSVS